MDNSKIGIRVADGTFYPIMEGENAGRKKLVLTTVNDDQSSVQIKLYKGQGEDFTNPQYIGNLLIENIPSSEKGEPEIELIIGLDEQGQLTAEAGGLGFPERQELKIDLDSLETEDSYVPDFELNDEEMFSDSKIAGSNPDFPNNLFDSEDTEFPDIEEDLNNYEDDFTEEFLEDDSLSDEFDSETDSPYADLDSNDEETNINIESSANKNRKKLAVIILILLIIDILGLGIFLVIKGMQSDKVPPLEASNSIKNETAAIAETDSLLYDDETNETSPNEEAPEQSEILQPIESETGNKDIAYSASSGFIDIKDMKPGQGGGVWYRLKWGDNLWDLSSSFYRTPWLYGLIASENEIKNPDLIYAGSDILIPEN